MIAKSTRPDESLAGLELGFFCVFVAVVWQLSLP